MKRICIISANPEFLGGISLYTWNTIKYLKKEGNEIFWVYGGNKNRIYKKNGLTFVEIKYFSIYPLNEIIFNFKVKKFLEKNKFKIINSHATWGFWMNFYKKQEEETIIHTYHGSTYYFFKNHLKRFNLFFKIILSPILYFSYFIEKPPMKKANKIICVSNHVKTEFKNLYGKRKNVFVIRTGVDLNKFKQINKKIARKKLNLDSKKIYGLYVGRGGYWRKGLDRAIKLSKNIYELNKNYKLIAIGPDYKKVKHLINKPFIKYIERGARDTLPYYYSSCDLFFFLSRYEGGAPTLVTSEAMASGCFVIFSEDSKQEIIENDKEGVIIDFNNCNYKKEAERILKILDNKDKLKEIIRNSLKKIKEFSLDNWAKKYLYVLFR
jgi:glycosyltransferase involved in cell wall biosynthesis